MGKRMRMLLGPLLGLCLLASVSWAGAESRVALVIGNAGYPTAPLNNPANDARSMAELLRKLDFDVISLIDADKKTMRNAITEFGKRLQEDGVGLFYYAGHGVQVKNENWLIPVDAAIDSESDVENDGIAVGHVLGKMEDRRSAVNIVILDACRNNPFSRGFRSVQRGLALMDAPRGSMIIYATAPGKVASDGDGKNGLFTQHLLEEMSQPGQSLQKTVLNVRVKVMGKTHDAQIPWDASSMTREFYPAGILPDDPGAARAALEQERLRLELARQSEAGPKAIGQMRVGQKLWAEPRALYGDKNRKLYLRRDSMAVPRRTAAETMFLEKLDNGFKADVTRCDYRFDVVERRGPADPEVVSITYFLTPSAMEKGQEMWAAAAALFADADRKLYLKGNAKLFAVKREDACLSIRRTDEGLAVDVRGCPKKFAKDVVPGKDDLPVADVVYK